MAENFDDLDIENLDTVEWESAGYIYQRWREIDGVPVELIRLYDPPEFYIEVRNDGRWSFLKRDFDRWFPPVFQRVKDADAKKAEKRALKQAREQIRSCPRP
jgi:hypothetical protein